MNPDLKAIRARADAAAAHTIGGDQDGMFLEDRIGTMVFAFSPGDRRIAAVRDLARRARDVWKSSADVPALLDYAERLEAQVAEARADALEAARLAIHAVHLEVEENERRAISKGSAPYTTIFRAVTLNNGVNAAIEALASPVAAPSDRAKAPE